MPKNPSVLAEFPHRLALARQAVLGLLADATAGRIHGDLYLMVRMLLEAIQLTEAACRLVAEQLEKRAAPPPTPREGWPNE